MTDTQLHELIAEIQGASIVNQGQFEAIADRLDRLIELLALRQAQGPVAEPVEAEIAGIELAGAFGKAQELTDGPELSKPVSRGTATKRASTKKPVRSTSK